METVFGDFTEKICLYEYADQERIHKALELAQSIETASILLELALDADTIIAALLLDSFRELPEAFADQWGLAVSLLLQGVRKIDGLKTNSKTINEAQNIRNMLLALTDDIRVILIKLAEKLQALRILDSSPDKERKTAARECLDIYAPLADRLGISWIKNEMEDLALKFLNREAYQQIKTIVAEKRMQRNLFLDQIKQTIIREAEGAGIKIEVMSRAKHFYSVYMKMRKRGKSADEIYDLAAMRIICETIENCYTLFGMVHRLWKPINGHLRDYIARPKPNGYQSLHTSLLVGSDEESPIKEERILEIQIRTAQMHQIAEYGIASHWFYKKGPSRDLDTDTLKRFKEWKISGSWLEDIKRDVFRKWIYLFTPQGKVIKLPKGSTPIDFAYHVHTAVGERCIGAKANGSIIPLNSELKNTQVVEILTSNSARPHFNWLSVVKTSKARSKIRSWLGKNDDAFISEKNLEKKKADTLSLHEKENSVSNTAHMAQMLIQPLNSALQVRIEDEKNLMLRFARCCNPVTGDSIVGYVSRGRGIIIHRKNCKSLGNNPEFEKRKIEAQWEKAGSALVKRFRIEAKRSSHLFSEIEGVVRKRQGHLIEGRLEENGANKLSGIFSMHLSNADDLKAVMKNIRNIPGIINIQLIE